MRAPIAYQQNSVAVGETAALEQRDPMSERYLDKVAHRRGAVARRLYEDEGTWPSHPKNVMRAAAIERFI